MKAILLLLFILFSELVLGQKKLQSAVGKHYSETGAVTSVDSIVHMYNSFHGSLTEFTPYIFLYRPIGNLICNYPNPSALSDKEFWYFSNSSGGMDLLYTRTKSYSNGNYLEINVDDESRSTYSYDSNGNCTLVLHEKDYGSGWEPANKTTITFDQYGNDLWTTSYQMNPVNQEWFVTDAYQYIYKLTSGKLIKSINYSPDNNGDLFVEYVYNYYYSNDLLNRIDDFGLIQGTLDLERKYSTFITYDQNWITKVASHYANDTLVHINPVGYYDYTYNSSGNMLSCTRYYGSPLQPYNIKEFEYNEVNFVSKISEYKDASFGPGLFLENTIDYNYQNTLETDEIQVVQVHVSPNPSQDIVTIESEGKINLVQLFNTKGQILLEQNTGTIDVRHLPAGIYTLKGSTSNGQFSERIVVN